MHALILLALLTADPWQQQTLDLINAQRADANLRELLIHGEVLRVRQPLVYDERLEASAQWWCDALRGTGQFWHFGLVNDRGFLIDASGRQVSRVWLPAMSLTDRTTFWWLRNRHLGIETAVDASSENGVLLKRPAPANIVNAWTLRSGWHDDPRQATKHYRNVVDPRWTHFGVARQPWGAGKYSVFGEFVELAP